MQQRTIGDFDDGTPRASETNGLAGLLGILTEKFEAFTLNSNYLSTESINRDFSLRWELFGIPNPKVLPGKSKTDALVRKTEADTRWAEVLNSHRKDLREVPDFLRCCVASTSRRDKPIPGIVIEFPTRITPGHNPFGRSLSGSSALPPNPFAVRIFASAVVLDGYRADHNRDLPGGLQRRPYAYLVPVGRDLTQDRADADERKEWRIVDMHYADAVRTESHLASRSTRLFLPMEAYPANTFDWLISPYDHQLIGRNIENTKWLLVIPGSALASDAEKDLDRLISLDPDRQYKGYGGLSDIKLYFWLYAYSS